MRKLIQKMSSIAASLRALLQTLKDKMTSLKSSLGPGVSGIKVVSVKLKTWISQVIPKRKKSVLGSQWPDMLGETTGSHRLITSTVVRPPHIAPHEPNKLLMKVPTLLPVIVGFAVADVVTDILYAVLHDLPNQITVTVPSQPAPPMVALKKNLVTELLDSNLFDHTNTVPGQMVAGGGTSLTPEQAVKSSLPHRLVGTIVFSEARRGIATIEQGKDVHSYAQGEEVQPGYKLWGVERCKAYLHNLNKNILEYLGMALDTDKAGSKMGVEKPSTPAHPPKEIKQVGENKFSVERVLIKEKLKNLQELLTQAQAVPTGDGWKIVTISPGSVFEFVGVRPGDVITRVNGKEVKTQADAIMLFNQFQSESQNNVQLEIKRDGQDQVLSYELK